jgi:hypothetical protein
MASEPEYEYDIKLLSTEVVKFEFLPEDIIDKTVCEFHFDASNDIDRTADRQFTYYQDFRLEAEKSFYIFVRCVFDITIEEENLYKFDTQRALITNTYSHVQEGIKIMHERAKKNVDAAVYKQPDDAFWNHYVSGMDHRNNIEGLKTFTANHFYDDYYTFEQTYAATLLADATKVIIDEIFFNNSAFNHRKNYQTLYHIIPVNCYLSLRQKINMLRNGGPVTINFHKFIFFIVAIDCACYLLTSDYFDFLEERLERFNFTPERRLDYLKIAQDFVRETKENVKQTLTLGNWEEKYDWQNLVY